MQHRLTSPVTSCRIPAGWSVGIGLAAFVFYLALTRGVWGDGDSAEFTLALATGGVPHPPGYPLYSLLGHAWVLLLRSMGASWAYAANSFSALGGGVAIGLLHALAARTVPLTSALAPGTRAAIALLPCALLGLQPLFVFEATRAEVHTWHIVILAGLGLVALRLLRAADGASAAPPGVRDAALWGLVCGAGLAHRPTAIFLIAPLGVAVGVALARSRRVSASQVLAFAGGAAASLTAYAFVAVRAHHPAAFQWPLLEARAASILAHIRSEIFLAYLGRFAPAPGEAAMILGALYPFLAGALLLLLGAAAFAREPALRGLLRALIVAAVLGLAFVFHYGIPDPSPYFLELLLAGLMGLAPALAGVMEWSRRPAMVAAGASGIIVLALGVWSVGQVAARQARLVAVEEAIRERWRGIPHERGIVLWNSDSFVRLLSYQILDGEKPGLYVGNPAMLTWAAPRRVFQERLGFDPLAGLELEDDSQLSLVPAHVATLTDLPVIDFGRLRP